MIYEASWTAVFVFILFVGRTVALSFFLGRKAKSSAGYFAAHGQIPWFVNGVAFAGDYLSAASFLGICGMIASYGYDGFLYSIGFLAGWIVALFVIAEPMKRLGRFTFADALDAKFDSRGIKAAAGISTLVVSVFYLIPQMVGAGSLIQPLLGFPHWVGVVMVGIVVITIVVTAGMVSTTWVQFLKGSLLVIFSAVLVVMVLARGFAVNSDAFQTIGPIAEDEVECQSNRRSRGDRSGRRLAGTSGVDSSGLAQTASGLTSFMSNRSPIPIKNCCDRRKRSRRPMVKCGSTELPAESARRATTKAGWISERNCPRAKPSPGRSVRFRSSRRSATAK